MAQSTVAADPLIPRRGLTRAEYDLLVEAGVLEGEPVELLEGTLVTATPQGWEHAHAITALTRWLVPRLPEPWLLAPQVPFAATTDSQPEPDLAVVAPVTGRHYDTASLVIEVAVSSQRADLVHKARVYAAAAVDQYWVLDVPAREVVVHTTPGEGGYASVVRQPWTSPLSVLGVEVDLAALLPRL